MRCWLVLMLIAPAVDGFVAAGSRGTLREQPAVRMGIKRKSDIQQQQENSKLGRSMGMGSEGGGLFPGGDLSTPDVSEYTNARKKKEGEQGDDDKQGGPPPADPPDKR